MKYANDIKEFINAFKVGPLEGEELNKFYCNDTMQYRTGDKYTSPILDIYDSCKIPSSENAFLLMGHRGCGKGTELNNMAADLSKEGYHIATIQCGQDLDMNNIIYTDLLILLGETLLEKAKEIKCDLSSTLINSIESYWKTEISEIQVVNDSASVSGEAEIGAEPPSILSLFLKMFVKIKSDIKFSQEKRTEYKTKISQRTSEWVDMINQIADEITDKLKGKQPIVIFEDLDKINSNNVWDIFGNYSVLLTSVTFPIIYTFPIAMSYDSRFSAVNGYFKDKTLPMIKQETIDGKRYEEGTQIITDIVKKRADIKLFEENVLQLLIEKTGGSLRDLFYAIHASAQRAIRRKSETISYEDGQRALEELKTSLTRRIEEKHYEFLRNIYKGNRTRISDKQMLLEMLQANTVLEYNGQRWHNVHPLIGDFLNEQGLV